MQYFTGDSNKKILFKPISIPPILMVVLVQKIN